MNYVTNPTKEQHLFSTKQMVSLSLLTALAYVLMLIHLPFKFLGFLELEFSDVPAIVATLTYGPIAGVVVELLKNVIKAITATTTGGVGEIANFVISACYIIPLGVIFRRVQTKKKLILSFLGGIIGFVIAGIVVNYFVTVPLYAKLFGGMEAVIGAASVTIPAIKSLATVVILGITPFNIVKGIMMSAVGYYVYKMLYPVVKA
ncbi:ECF transporter S component [Velocimicrobium porci]|uniref:Riboflavin transporter n=1 Tax=Velocimicrobium porci TaxID=2606634 RepID=A0A6L5Y0U7_9FIRM|nr:ECF transporter S component [Velocimicrobium porci]MSS63803.1 ECF transporter S component [Velocimicrobium porci]